jgi:hypothetical protein
VIKGVVEYSDCIKQEAFKELYSDMWDECSNYGPIVSIKIPRPVFVDRSAENAKTD